MSYLQLSITLFLIFTLQITQHQVSLNYNESTLDYFTSLILSRVSLNHTLQLLHIKPPLRRCTPATNSFLHNSQVTTARQLNCHCLARRLLDESPQNLFKFSRLRYIAVEWTPIYCKHITWSLSSEPTGASVGLTEKHRLPPLLTSRVAGVCDVTVETQRSRDPYWLLRNPSVHRAVA
jgi:hypothetical protein